MQVGSRARGIGVATIAGIVLLTSSAAAPAPAEAASPADKVIAIARAQLGDPWRYGATGPSAFDCSGLVIYAFRQAGYGHLVGDGRYRSARAMYYWFRDRGKAVRSNPYVGDVVVWGGGTHVGIYIGGGKAISTLTSGVRIHGVHAVTAPFTAYLRTGLSSSSTSSATVATTSTTASSGTRYTTTRLRLRSGPSTGYRTLTILPTRDRLTVVGKSRDGAGRLWYKVTSRYAGRTGWVAGWYTRAA